MAFGDDARSHVKGILQHLGLSSNLKTGSWLQVAPAQVSTHATPPGLSAVLTDIEIPLQIHSRPEISVQKLFRVRLRCIWNAVTLLQYNAVCKAQLPITKMLHSPPSTTPGVVIRSHILNVKPLTESNVTEVQIVS